MGISHARWDKNEKYFKNKRGANMKRCSKCVMPETQETIAFDDKGVCNVCKQVAYKNTKIDWEKRKEEFIKIIDKYRGESEYDCIIPFSGGKDSTYTAYKMVRDFKVKPLIVSFDHWFYRPNTIENREKTLKKLDVDFITYRPRWGVVKKLMLESLLRKGDFCWHCHAGISCFPMHMAIKYETPLIIWGEPSAEYTAYYSYDEIEQKDEEYYNKFANCGLTAQDMVGMLNDPTITMRDLKYFSYPALKELKRIDYTTIFLGNFTPWNVKNQAELIKKELGWKGDEVEGIPPGYDYEKVECMLTGVRDYVKYIKRGFARVSHLTSIDIRQDRMTREKAMEYIKQFEGKRPESLDYLLEMLGITEEQFNMIAVKNAVHPYEHDFSKTERGKKLWDQNLWNNSATLDNEEAKKQIDNYMKTKQN